MFESLYDKLTKYSGILKDLCANVLKYDIGIKGDILYRNELFLKVNVTSIIFFNVFEFVLKNNI